MSTQFDSNTLNPATLVATAARPPRVQGSPVNPPITISSTYRNAGEPDGSMLYARWTNESWHGAEELIATLEKAEQPALLFASGMAAVCAAMHMRRPGSDIVIPRHAYHASLLLARDRTAREGAAVREVDIADTDSVLAALDAQVGLLWIESPTNPMLEVADIPRLAQAAHECGALVVVDNTFATPLGQQPLLLGADVVVHSATKYLSGHSDVVLGAAVTSSPQLHQALQTERTNAGAIAGPMEAWLLLRGMRTLCLRVERMWANAAELARRMEAHTLIAYVGHPSLESHPQHERASTLLAGFGGVLTFRPIGGVAAAEALAEFTRIWLPATSLGGVESSYERRRRFATEAPTVPEDLIRASVGIENVEDLWADLTQALERAHAGIE